MKFISDEIKNMEVDKTSFNIISSGTGTGKTWFVVNELNKYFPNIRYSEILFITSRSLIVEQQSKSKRISKYDMNNLVYINHWNGASDSTELLERKGIQIMTYDKIINILATKNIEGLETLNKIKLIIFDECHTLFSDKFIKDIEMLKVWIRDILYVGNKIILGMTATPNIIFYYQNEWGVTINQINSKVLINYKAKQLHCTDFDTIPYIITTNQIEGKTIIMCYSVDDCYKLKNKIPNSCVLVSKSNKSFTKEMKKLREYIVKNESLPDTFIENKTEKKLKVLITTSTLREGVNLREESGVKNVICCFTDELHITQFMGRCRFNIDNLIVAHTYIRTDNFDTNSYLSKCREAFKDFMRNKNSTSWFDSISHLVEHDVYKTIKFILGSEEKKFINYINSKWLVPDDILDKNQLDKYKIYKEEDKQEIIKKVIECKLLNLCASKITFNRVVDLMANSLGYSIESNRLKIKNKKYTYKLVIDFDEEKIIYQPIIREI